MRISLSAVLTMYHGSQYSNVDFKNIKVLYCITDRREAERYAKGEVHFAGKWPQGIPGPTVYELHINTNDVFDMRIEMHQRIYDEIRAAYPDEELPSRKSMGFIQRTGLPGYGEIRGMRQGLLDNGFDGIWVDEGSQGISLALFNRNSIQLIKPTRVTL